MTGSLKESLESFYAAKVWEDMTLGKALLAWSENYGDNIALTEADRQVTYQELEREAGRIGAGLQRRGFGKGDKIVLQIPNSIEFVVSAFALFKLGVIPVMALPAQRKTEIKGIMEKSGAKGYVIKDNYLGFDYKSLAREICRESQTPPAVIVIGQSDEFIAYEDLREGPELSDEPEIGSGEVGLFLLSGGTTGIPKLIPRRHADYLYVAQKTAERCRLNQESVYLAALPVAHNFPLGCPGLLGTLTVGGRVVICTVASPDEIIPLIEEEGVTITGLVPALAHMCIEFLELDDGYDISSLKVIQVGGAVLDSYLAARIEKAFACTLQQIFGIAEGLICCTDLADGEEIRYHTQGKPISAYDEIMIVDEKGREVPVGEYGELTVRGPYTIYGYYNLEEVNQSCLSDQGYFKTGDKARWQDGNLQVAGRLKEMINRAGEKITPSELEELLLRHEDIGDVQVVGIEDQELGERICVFILAQNKGLTLNGLRNYLVGQQVASYKLPDQLVYLEAWPLTNVGKIDRKQLRVLGTQR